MKYSIFYIIYSQLENCRAANTLIAYGAFIETKEHFALHDMKIVQVIFKMIKKLYTYLFMLQIFYHFLTSNLIF